MSSAAMLPPPPLPRPLHMRGNSADSTLTESSVLNPYPRPKRPSPRKRAAKPTKSPKSVVNASLVSPSKSTSNLRRVELHGSDELQLSEQVKPVYFISIEIACWFREMKKSCFVQLIISCNLLLRAIDCFVQLMLRAIGFELS